MWDLHSHILPEIDDGAKDIIEFIEMAKIAVQDGIHTMVTTPHYISSTYATPLEKLYRQLDICKETLKEEGIPLTLLPGMEIYSDWDMIKNYDDKKIITLNHSRYILVELPMIDIPKYMEDLLYELKVRKLIPIIAHPERNTKIQENPNILKKWIEDGVLAQLNVASLMGLLGSRTQKTAEILLNHNMIHLLASDAHSPRKRVPRLKEGSNKIKEILGKESANLILEQYPKAILEDILINTKEPKKYKNRKKFLFI